LVLHQPDLPAVHPADVERPRAGGGHHAVHVDGVSHHLLLLLERDLDRDEREPEPDEDDRLRDRLLLLPLRDRERELPSEPSSSSPVILSLIPSSTPLVFDSAPPEVIDSISCGSPSDSESCTMSSRFTASANRR